MTFDQIRSFHLIATLGTFAQAAERLGMTQPAVSARMAALEDHLGVALFDRSGQRATLTPDGRRFLRSAEKLLDIHNEILTETGKGMLSGLVRIGVSDTMAVTWIPGWLSDLRHAYPEALVELHTGSSFHIQQELLARRIDIGFMVGPVSDPEIVNRVLCDCPLVMVAPPAMKLHGRRIGRDELQGLDLVTFERVTRPYQELLSSLRAIDIAPRINPVNSLQAVILLTCRGFGVGVVPLGTVARELERGELEVLNVAIDLTPIRFAACHVRGPESAAAHLLADRAVGWLRQQGDSPGLKLRC